MLKKVFRNPVAFIVGFMMPTILMSCTDAVDAKRILENEGVSDIQITGYKWFACSKDDTYHTGFTAIKNGKHISGVVCAGLFFKGSTIRYF